MVAVIMSNTSINFVKCIELIEYILLEWFKLWAINMVNWLWATVRMNNSMGSNTIKRFLCIRTLYVLYVYIHILIDGRALQDNLCASIKNDVKKVSYRDASFTEITQCTSLHPQQRSCKTAYYVQAIKMWNCHQNRLL